MQLALFLHLPLLASVQESPVRLELKLGETAGAIEAQTPQVRSKVLGSTGYRAVNRGVSYLFSVVEAGPFTFQLVSSEFDAFLVLREAEGEVLAEDDDGFLLPDAQIVARLEAGRSYQVDAVALHGRTGSFSLRAIAGEPPPMLAQERHVLALARSRHWYDDHVRRLGPHHPETVARLELLAFQLWWGEEYTEFVDLLRPLLEASETLRGPDHPDTARCLKHLADGLAKLGDYEEAERMHRRALAIREEKLGPDDPATFGSLSALALLLLERGRDEEAEAYLVQARERRRSAGGTVAGLERDILSGLAAHLRRRKRYEEAERYYRLAIGGENPTNAFLPTAPWDFLGLGKVLLERDRIDEAEVYLERARTMLVEEWGDAHPCWIQVISGLGDLARRRGDLEGASGLHAQALERARKSYGPKHPITATYMGILSGDLGRLGRIEEAERLRSEMLSVLETSLGSSHPTTALAKRRLALLRFDLGRTEEAWTIANRAAVEGQEGLALILDSCSELDRYEYAANHRWVVDTLLSLTAAAPSPERERAAYGAFLAWKGIVFRTLSRGRKTVPKEELETNEKLRQVRSRLSDLLWGGPGAEPEILAASINELRDQREELESRLARAGAASGRSDGVRTESIQRALPPGAVLIDFHVGGRYRPARREGETVTAGEWLPQQLTAWVLRQQDDRIRRVDLGSAEEVRGLVARFLATLAAPRGIAANATESTSNAAAVWRRLWAPLEEHVGDARLVLLAPDDFLGSLPFETLSAEDGSYLLERHAFVYLQDAAMLVDLARGSAPKAPSTFLALGGVDFDSNATPDPAADEGTEASGETSRSGLRSLWLPLPESAREADTVALLAKRSLEPDPEILVLRGSEATEDRLTREMVGRDILHLATHGFFQPEGVASSWEQARHASDAGEFGLATQQKLLTSAFPGLLSGLVLAGANVEAVEGREDGLLTADEVAWLDLDGCRLVVLSACETGLGTTRGGEGMQSLRRAFHQAGVRTVVSSLWRVQDEQTVELMTGFYRRLWEQRLGAEEALRGARLEVLNRNRARFRGDGLPASWGAFVLSGDWR